MIDKLCPIVYNSPQYRIKITLSPIENQPHCFMQKKLVSMTNFAIILTALLSITQPVNAQELSKPMVALGKPDKLITINHPGIYSTSSTLPLNTLLVPINPENRWHVVYQQPDLLPTIAGVQFHSELHVFVTQPDTTLMLSITPETAPAASESTKSSTPSATAVKTATPSAVITINKSEPVVTPIPTVTPRPITPKPIALEPSALDALFAKYGAEYGVSPELLKRIAQCESGLRPEALSSNGLYGGLFQFVSSTWSSNRKAMGLDPDPALRFNAEEAIRTGAYKIARGGIGAWPVCGKKAVAATTVASL